MAEDKGVVFHELGLPSQNLTLELTETYLIKQEARKHHLMKQIHEVGICLAMDDFGIWYSSLSSPQNILY